MSRQQDLGRAQEFEWARSGYRVSGGWGGVQQGGALRAAGSALHGSAAERARAGAGEDGGLASGATDRVKVVNTRGGGYRFADAEEFQADPTRKKVIEGTPELEAAAGGEPS